MFDGLKRLAQKFDEYIENKKEKDLAELRAKVEIAKKDEARLDETIALKDELIKIEEKKKKAKASLDDKYKKLNDEFKRKSE